MWKVKWKLYKTSAQPHMTCSYMATMLCLCLLGIAVSFVWCEHAYHFRRRRQARHTKQILSRFPPLCTLEPMSIHFPTQAQDFSLLSLVTVYILYRIHFTFTHCDHHIHFSLFLHGVRFWVFQFRCASTFSFSQK